MQYFDFFELPVSFLLDEDKLKRQYYANSKKYHPDFFTLESGEKQAEILKLSTLNNQAYRTLKDFDSRMQYILRESGVLGEEGANKDIPQDFLLEMMDINEQLMELEFDFDPDAHKKVQSELQVLEDNLWQQVKPALQAFEGGDEGALERVKDYYLKKRYLLRIRENLNKFASR